MTNEQLAEQGIENKYAMEQLYLKNKPMIYKYCKAFENDRYTVDDLMQEAYIVLIIAVCRYLKHKQYKFLTFLINSLKWYFLRLNKGDKNRSDMLILDVQLSEDDETTRAEQLKDERALNDFEQLIDNIAM